MATQVDPKELDIRAQMASIDEALANAARARAEINQREQEMSRIRTETALREKEINRIEQDMFWKPWQVVTTVVGGAAALVAASITLTKLFL